MTHEINRFRGLVSGITRLPKPAQSGSLIEATTITANGQRPPYLRHRWIKAAVLYDNVLHSDRRELTGRLWAIHAAQLPIQGQVGSLTLVSSGLNEHALEEYIDFGNKPDGSPAITLHRSLANEHSLQTVNNWVARPEPQADFLRPFPAEALEAISEALGRAAFYSRPDPTAA